MRIDRRLNIVVPVDRGGVTVYFHSMPVSQEVLENYTAPLARTYAAVVELGIGNSCGPNVALTFLRRISEQLGVWEGSDGVRDALLPEIYRLTNVVAPNTEGWKSMPYEVALKREVIDADDSREAMGALVFFMLVCAMSKRSQVADRLAAPGRAFGFQTTSLSDTAWMHSLPTSKPEENTGERKPELLVPS